MPFSTNRFTAQVAREKDIQAIREIESLPQNRPFVFQYSHQEHLDFLQAKGHYTLLFYSKKDLIGYALLTHDEKNRSLELRRIALSALEKGYGSELILGIHEWGFEELSIHRLWLDVFENNARAIHLYEKLGYTYEGTLRDTYFNEGKFISQRVYSLLEEEYKAAKEKP